MLTVTSPIMARPSRKIPKISSPTTTGAPLITTKARLIAPSPTGPKSSRSNRNYAAAYHNRAAGYYRKRELDHAIADFAKAIEINPKDVAAYNGRSVAYLYKGDFGRAIADSRKAEQLQSADAQGSH